MMQSGAWPEETTAEGSLSSHFRLEFVFEAAGTNLLMAMKSVIDSLDAEVGWILEQVSRFERSGILPPNSLWS